MSDLYLVAHKVRGEPAFDIALKLEMGEDGEPWWIIPTSGHRAYPYWHTLLTKWDFWEYSGAEKALAAVPEDWPDHYTPRPEVIGSAGGLLAKLGLLGKPKGKLWRRPL